MFERPAALIVRAFPRRELSDLESLVVGQTLAKLRVSPWYRKRN
jgi:hypothetical protein